MNVREDHVVLPNGVELAEYHVLEMPDWVCVVCPSTMPDGEDGIVLVRQYRHAAGRMSLELPAGAIEPGESPEDAGRRELLEETGYQADEVSVLQGFYADPSRITNMGHVAVAAGAKKIARPELDPGEDIEVEVVPVSRLRALISGGELAHATHVAAILIAAFNGYLSLDPPTE